MPIHLKWRRTRGPGELLLKTFIRSAWAGQGFSSWMTDWAEWTWWAPVNCTYRMWSIGLLNRLFFVPSIIMSWIHECSLYRHMLTGTLLNSLTHSLAELTDLLELPVWKQPDLGLPCVCLVWNPQIIVQVLESRDQFSIRHLNAMNPLLNR